MCLVSSKIKFCTCEATDISSLKHYWIFHSYRKHQDIMVMGIPVLPKELDMETDAMNSETLYTRINEPDAFDVQLHPKENDRLEIAIHCPPYGYSGYLLYGFEWRNGKWEKESYETFEWERKHKEKMFGELRQVLKK